MTKAEYVRVSPQEKYFGDKNLLQSQLELLHLIQSFQKYKSLRNEELVLKIALKNKVGEAINLVDKLERLLPVAHYKSSEPKETEHERKKRERKLSLEQEIERIRQKLSGLQKGM
jgi:predicted nuclease with TOPRIM domain